MVQVVRCARQGLTPQDILRMLAASARRASASLGVTLGQLSVGAAGDVVVTDYVPFTALTSENLAGHVIFAMGPQHVRHVRWTGDGCCAIAGLLAATNWPCGGKRFWFPSSCGNGWGHFQQRSCCYAAMASTALELRDNQRSRFQNVVLKQSTCLALLMAS